MEHIPRLGSERDHFSRQDLRRRDQPEVRDHLLPMEMRPHGPRWYRAALTWAEVTGVDGVSGGEQLWVRGGFPDSLLARNDAACWRWREEFIATYLERDIPSLGPRLPAALLRRFWTMLSHQQGGQFNASQLAASLGVTGKTVTRYVDLLTDLLLVRQLAPWFRNIGKRLVKAPKVYVRDSGLLHCLANIQDHDTLLGHPLCGPSWEGLVIENLLALAPTAWRPFFFRTSAGAEIDLILEKPGGEVIAIEIKRTLQPVISRGFRQGCEDVGAQERYYVLPEGSAFALDARTTALALPELLERLRSASPGDSRRVDALTSLCRGIRLQRCGRH